MPVRGLAFGGIGGDVVDVDVERDALEAERPAACAR
jgi:hypothetical protein